ncbi:aldo/keto reductase [Helicobacter suis]|uniref:2,5-diketo-D-gluconic acid reductase n=3 Tax=Helicobacter suis TaxID=104628 RepID=A0A6J4CYW6_9HELI|nr:aldo/keto reductase [Helicobacter suis]BCD48200.1 2,5-diketo-D-gluconic acid reductase [Helicobacter suis]BCD49959.1 2,5-diketo-D-gluconic acid reductase [Helicobacter suis]BCD69922.1 2,5-diketo-D-gluconic acid reductase [Helicobacter suis]BDR28411.1 2,5-diketo-D-gluconic acid reductase [Helicobacter suis HS1]
MEFVTLNNGVKIPILGFGVFQIPDDACEKAVLEAIECGYRLIDTAQMYQNEGGVGSAIKKTSVPREELFITTKVWFNNAGEKKAKASIECSLRRMQLDYLDLVLIHQPFNDYYGTYRALEDLYKEGKLKCIGVSNFYPDRLADLVSFTQVVPAINQIEINPFHQQIKAQETMQKYKVQPQAWGPFAEGRNNIFNNSTLQEIANKHNKSIAQVILRWLVQREIVVLFKTDKKVRMVENSQIFDFSLPSEDMQTIAQIDQQQSAFFDHRDPGALEFLKTLPTI